MTTSMPKTVMMIFIPAMTIIMEAIAIACKMMNLTFTIIMIRVPIAHCYAVD